MKSRSRRIARPAAYSRPDLTRGCWSVMIIDGEPIRNKARKDYEKVLRDIDKAKAEVERFEREDSPRFSKWLHSTFGAVITEARELNQRLMQARAQVSEVQQEHFFGGHRSIAEAYQTVMDRAEEERRAAEEPGQEEAEFSHEEEEEDFTREEEEAFRDFASAMGFDLEDEESMASRSRKAAELPARLKELYRAVVRRLHPDKLETLSPREVEWWHQAQAAYEAGNAEQLELILTLCEVEDRGTKETSVSVLGQLVAHFKSSLRALKKRLTECKRDPAWNFSKLEDYSGLERRAAGMFEEQVRVIRVELAYYEDLLEKWKRQAATPPAKARRGSRRRQVEEEFLF